MSEERFRRACDLIINQERTRNGIGTLGEKTLHAVLKHYFAPDETTHEIKIESYVADILFEDKIIEIQTGNFDKLRKKLEVFLKVAPVTIVYPIAKTKWIYWIDHETGEAKDKRKSPKQGSACEVFLELYKIKQYLTHPNIVFCLMLLNVDEYRNLNGWSEDRKRGSSRFDRIPVELVEEIYITDKMDYSKLIPSEICSQFNSKQFKKHSRMNLKGAQTALNILHHVGAIQRVGKEGNMHVYERT